MTGTLRNAILGNGEAQQADKQRFLDEQMLKTLGMRTQFGASDFLNPTDEFRQALMNAQNSLRQRIGGLGRMPYGMSVRENMNPFQKSRQMAMRKSLTGLLEMLNQRQSSIGGPTMVNRVPAQLYAAPRPI